MKKFQQCVCVACLYRVFCLHFITDEGHAEVCADQCAKDTPLREVILRVLEDGVGTAEHHLTCRTWALHHKPLHVLEGQLNNIT